MWRRRPFAHSSRTPGVQVDQEAADAAMLALDKTDNKGELGANAVLGVSLAVAKAGAAAKGVPLYRHFADLAGNAEPPPVRTLTCRREASQV